MIFNFKIDFKTKNNSFILEFDDLGTLEYI